MPFHVFIALASILNAKTTKASFNMPGWTRHASLPGANWLNGIQQRVSIIARSVTGSAMLYLDGNPCRDEAVLWSIHEIDILHNIAHRIDMDNLGLHSTVGSDYLCVITPQSYCIHFRALA